MSATLSPPAAAGLSLGGLQLAIGGSPILRGVDLIIQPGSVFCLMGRNGVGKSTTLKAIMGLLPLAAGAIEFAGMRIEAMATAERARCGLAYVPQGREIFPHLSVEENLFIGARARGLKPLPAEIERIYALFPILRDFLRRKGGMLSGGQQQQLAIARALASSPKLLVLDEPTEGIQPSIIKDIGRVIKMLANRGDMGILLCEQYYDFAEELADYYVVMDRGEVVAKGPGSEMVEKGIRQIVAI